MLIWVTSIPDSLCVAFGVLERLAQQSLKIAYCYLIKDRAKCYPQSPFDKGLFTVHTSAASQYLDGRRLHLNTEWELFVNERAGV